MSVVSTFIIIILVVSLAYKKFWMWKNKKLVKFAAKIPGPPTLPLIGNALMFLCKPEELMDKIIQQSNIYGEHFRFWLGTDLNIVVLNPNDIKTLLTSNKINSKGPVYKIMEEFIGPGILTGGRTWRGHRKIASPSYNKRSVQSYNYVFNMEAKLLVDQLRNKNPNVTINIFNDVIKTTTQCVCQTLMGLSKEDSTSLKLLDTIVSDTDGMYSLVLSKMLRPWYQIPFVYNALGLSVKQKQYVDHIIQFATNIVNMRRNYLNDTSLVNDDLNNLDGGIGKTVYGIVDRFIMSGELNEIELIMETFTLFTTSQEASAKIVSGVLLGLAHNQDWQDKVLNEIVEVMGDTERNITDEDLKLMPYLDMVFKEALRYWPIAAIIQRTVDEDIEISIGTIPKGTSLGIPLHALHRNNKYWNEPNKFIPDRFQPEHNRRRNPNCFIPFSLGPMDCLGRVYSASLIKIILIHIVRHYKLEAEGEIEELPISVAISVKSADGYNMKISRRTAH